jgi:two-component system, cell cycle sensor histidine kinase and response regulator CckA
LENNRGTETILLVEDEEFLRNVVVDLLSQLGYRVLAAANGKEALALSKRNTGPIDILITDVAMPGLAGPELAATLRASLPGLKIIFVSGSSEPDCELTPGAVMLMKPFTIRMLSSKMREVLDA